MSYTKLHIVEYARRGLIEKVIECIERGDDVNDRDYLGDTALIIAARDHNLEMVKILIEAGADCNVKGLSNLSPLNYAKIYKNNEMKEYIEEHIANSIRSKEFEKMEDKFIPETNQCNTEHATEKVELLSIQKPGERTSRLCCGDWGKI